MKLNPAIQSWPLFVLAITIKIFSSLLLIGCVHANFVDLWTMKATPDLFDFDSLNFFSRAIIGSAIRSVESSGNNSPAAVFDSARSTLYLLGGVSIFASTGAVLILAFGFKPQTIEDGD